ncbi:MAG: PAS domain-containing protein [Pseudomonadota bacterium]|nr:PAS domain-containing protein [Pseudomonadota bacterium]
MNEIEDLQKALFNTIPDMAWLKDRQSRYLAVNEAYVAASGLKEHQILNRTPLEIWPQEWGKTYLQTDEEVMRTGKRKRYEEWRYDPDGQLRWFDTIKTPFRNSQGEIIGTTGISRDITQRKKAEEELARLNRFYAVRSRINQMIARTRNRQSLFAKTCQILVEEGGLKAASIGLFSSTDHQLDTRACFPKRSVMTRRMKQLLADWSSREKERFKSIRTHPFICNEAQLCEPLFPLPRFTRHYRSSSFALFPLVEGRKFIGILFLLAKEEHFFSEDIVSLMRELIADLSYSLTAMVEARRRLQAEEDLLESRRQLRELSAYLQKVREEERLHVCRELHDELGQTLTALGMGLQRLKKDVSLRNTEGQERLGSLIHLTRVTTETVRRIASDLRPLMLDELGLEPSMEWLVETFSSQSAIQVDFHCDLVSVRFDEDTNTALFRILQESLTNVSRHAKASWVHIDIRETEADIQMRIQDNGCGIPDIGDAYRKSLGLVGMRERAYMLGGSLVLSSAEKTGTQIEVVIPKNHRRAEA